MADTMQTWPVAERVDHSETIFSLSFDDLFPIGPGEFLTLWLPGVDEKPFSVSNRVAGRTEITICAVGPFTRALQQVEPGQRVGLRGPFGTGFTLADNALLVGGGMGIAPLRYLAGALTRSGCRCDLLLGARDAHGLFFGDEFEAAGAALYTEDGSRGRRGRVTDGVATHLATGRYKRVYACGPEAMLLALRRLCDDARVDYEFAFERYMKCGIGICGQCCLDGSGIRVCQEGPVLGPTHLAGVTELGLPHRDATGRR